MEQSLDKQAAFDIPEAIELARRARDANPRFLSAHWLYITLVGQEGRRHEAREYYARRASADREMACLAIMAGAPANGSGTETPRMIELAQRRGISRCVALLLPDLSRSDVPGLPGLLELRRRSLDDAPAIARPWEMYAGMLAANGDTTAADSVLRVALVAVRHPIERVQLLARRASLGAGSVAGARWNALRDAVLRDGRAGMRLRLFYAAMSYRAGANPPDAELDERVRSASPGIRCGYALTRAFIAVGRGDYVAAMPHFDEALRIADSMPDGQNAVAVGLQRGRALSRLGKLQDAERALVTAYLRARGTSQRYSLAEIWHNLSHTYESLGRPDQAIAASDSFVAAAAGLYKDPIRIISRRDAGLLRLTLGWHAAARVQFNAMVRHIDAEQQNHYWAGEYYERIGDARAAIDYYRRGAADAGERSLNLSGLARSYEALGMSDSAAAAAIDHDRYINTPTEVALAPEVLSRLGQHHEAIRLALDWATRRENGGSVQGAALARIQVARLALAAGRAADARDNARAALRHAMSLQLVAERVDALRLIGLADRALGRSRDAVAHLREAVLLAHRLGDVRLVRETYATLADLHADLGVTDSAFAAWDRAAVAVESGAAALSDDVDRARFRAVHLAPFDAALQYALRIEADADTPERLARWSARRKAAAILLTARGTLTTPAEATSPRRLSQIRSRLSDDRAVVDWILLPDQVAALVVRRHESRLVRLDIPPDSVAELTRRLTLPFARRGRSVDLARAVFDTAAAATLYDALIAPLRPMLGGVRRLTLIPDGPLHHVPFPMLVRRDPAPAYLLDEFELDHTLSLAALSLARGRSWRGAPALVVVTDVPGGAEERVAIRNAWRRGTVQELVGQAASERAVRASVPGAAIVHFATHAEANDRNPLATHMRLAADLRDDGLLHLREIGPRSYSGRLVVLASCESLAGPLLMGEGLVGLSRAFVLAGAAGVVATRWPIGAASASFSRVFYDALGRGLSFSAATREAQLRLRSRPATSNPFFWGGYVAVAGAEAPAQSP